jgi:SAM-dependent methyltransferase
MKEKDKNQKTIEAYNKKSLFYAETFDSYGINLEDIDRALNLNESGSNNVLELGCGNGKDAQYIISKVGFDNYIGVDAAEGMIKFAREKIPKGMFQVKDMRKVSYETENFGVIFSFASMLHVNREEMAKLVDKCYSSLKKGGILFISTKYGSYREEKVINLGDEKYYYLYEPKDIEILCPYKFFVVYKNVQDIRGQSWFEIALRKI